MLGSLLIFGAALAFALHILIQRGQLVHRPRMRRSSAYVINQRSDCHRCALHRDPQHHRT